MMPMLPAMSIRIGGATGKTMAISFVKGQGTQALMLHRMRFVFGSQVVEVGAAVKSKK